jgi:hypothetical protein
MLDGSVKLIAQCSQAAGFVSSGTPQPEAVTDPRMVAACSETKAQAPPQLLALGSGRGSGPSTTSPCWAGVRWHARCWPPAWCIMRSLCRCQTASCSSFSAASQPLSWGWAASATQTAGRCGQSQAAAVASLPKQLGGIGQVDVAAHITAMQAKVAAALLHPHRRAWKQFMRARPGAGSAGRGGAAAAFAECRPRSSSGAQAAQAQACSIRGGFPGSGAA